MQTGRSLVRVGAAALLTAAVAQGAGGGHRVSAAGAWHNVVYVADHGAASVTAYDVATATTTTIAIPGLTPRWVALTPDGGTAVVSSDSGGVAEIDTASGTVTRTITGVGGGGVAITPDGATAWVNTGTTLTPITIATGATGTPIALPGPVAGNPCGYSAGGVVLSADGVTAYAVDPLAEVVVPVNLATATAGTPIAVSSCPLHIAIGVEGVDPLVYVTDNTNQVVWYVDTASDQVVAHQSVTTQPYGAAETWNALLVGDLASPSHILDGSPRPGSLPQSPCAGQDLAVTPDGGRAWVSNGGLAYSVALPMPSGCPAGSSFNTDPSARGIAVTPELLSTAGVAVTATAGQPFSGTVATFTDPNTARPLSDFAANVDWGDGSSTPGVTVTGSAGSFTVSAGHTYTATGTYTVRVQIGFRQSRTFGVSTTATVSPGPPGAPANTAAAGGGGRILLSWSAPAQNYGSPVTGYDVYVGTTPGGESSTPANASPVTGTAYTVTGLSNGTPYYLEVRAINACGQGPSSNEASATPVQDDFTIGVTPAMQWLNPGTSVAYTVSTSNTAGLGQTLTPTVTGLPPRVTGFFANATMNSGDSDLLTLTAASNALPSKLRTFTVTATGPETTHSATAQVEVIPLGVANGGFATGTLVDWSKKGTAAVVQGSSADGDGYAAQVGNPTATNVTSSIAQTFTVPSGATSITFSYWGYCTDTADRLSVTVRDVTNGKMTTDFTTCVNSTAWASKSGVLTPGDVETITLGVRDDADGGVSNYALFDAISIPGFTSPTAQPRTARHL